MNSNGTSQGPNDLEESTDKHNSNLQRLIEVIGGILAASGELLARLQQILSRSKPAEGPTSAPHPPDDPPPPDGHQA